MSRRGWVLFAAMSVIWGVPYLLIKVAVAEVAPPVLVAARTGLTSLVLVPLAIKQGALRPALAHWRPLLAFTVLEMAVPWLLLTDADVSSRRASPASSWRRCPSWPPWWPSSSVTAHRSRPCAWPVSPSGCSVWRSSWGSVETVPATPGNVTEVLLVAVGYAVAPFIADRRLGDVPALGVVAASLGIVAIGYLPAAVVLRPETVPSADALWSMAGLAVLCTGMAFLVFFALIAEVGPGRATLITFVNPVVAVSLGIVVLDEPLTGGLLAGLPPRPRGLLARLPSGEAERGPRRRDPPARSAQMGRSGVSPDTGDGLESLRERRLQARCRLARLRAVSDPPARPCLPPARRHRPHGPAPQLGSRRRRLRPRHPAWPGRPSNGRSFVGPGTSSTATR